VLHLSRQSSPLNPAALSRELRHAKNRGRSCVPSCRLRKSDDTHIQRATTLRSHPLATLAGRGCLTLLPARHVARAVLGGSRLSGAVPSAVAVVAVLRLALARHHRLASHITPPPAVSRHALARRYSVIAIRRLCVGSHRTFRAGQPLRGQARRDLSRGKLRRERLLLSPQCCRAARLQRSMVPRVTSALYDLAVERNAGVEASCCGPRNPPTSRTRQRVPSPGLLLIPAMRASIRSRTADIKSTIKALRFARPRIS
jgi:hypothetical protein